MKEFVCVISWIDLGFKKIADVLRLRENKHFRDTDAVELVEDLPLVLFEYDPSPAQFIAVPKSMHSTRPAALLNLADRVVFEALVESLRPRIDSALLGKAIVFWPRGIRTEKAWREFENSATETNGAYVVIADISAFYESVDHVKLTDRLIRMAVCRRGCEGLVLKRRIVTGNHRSTLE